MKEESGKKEDITRKKGNDISEKVELLTVEEEERVSKIFSYKSMIAYKLNGSQIIKLSSQNYLELMKEQIRKSQHPNTKDEEDEEETIKVRRKKNFRYFHQLQGIKKCYRCGQWGHYLKNCPNIHFQCLYCFGNHDEDDCCDIYCQNCSEKGHQSQQCKYRGKICKKCSKIGHEESECKSIVVLDRQKNKQMLEDYSKDDLCLLACMNCGSTQCGHFNCFQYEDQLENVYMNNFILD